LTAGKTLRIAATELNITYQTARSTLKSIFQKTGTHRQSELIIKLLSKSSIALTVLVGLALTESKGRGEWPDGPNKTFLENLQRPDIDQHPYWRNDPKNLSCCGVADTVKTKYRVESIGGAYPEDVWYAWLEEQWVRIPPEKIVKDYSPDGQPYLFLLAGTIQCFVRPKGGGYCVCSLPQALIP
jgi:hypothetical protein